MSRQGESVHVAFAILILIVIPVELTLVSNYYTCPGIPQNEVGTKEQIKIGVVLEKPINFSPINLAEMGINTTSQEGEFILQYSDYGMIAFKEIEHINKLKMHHHHHICLHYTFIDRNFKNIAYGANYIYLSNSVQQVVNGIKDNYQNKIHNDLMMRYTPVVSITHYQCIDICPSSPSPLAKIFLGAKYETPSCIGLKDANLKIVTTASSLFRAANEFLKVMGWRKFGIVTTCAHLLEYWPGNERVHLSLYLKNKKLIQTFDQAFQRYELNVYVFIGSIKTFYELLLDFDSYGFNRNYRNYVWVMPFFSPNFHHELYFKMFNYTNEEIKSIRKGLDNLIIIKPSENAHVDIKNGTISHVTDYQGYVLDALMLQVKAAVNLIERKAEKTGVNISNVIIEREDYDDLVLQLFNATFAGYSGQVDFNSQCNRITNTFVILNYVSEYINGSYCNETLIKGFIITTQYSVKIRFYTQNGSMTMESSIMFKDKTYNIPLDHIERLYIREPKIVNSLIAGSAIIYIIMTVSYVTCIYYQDKCAKIYNESWLYQNNEITYNFGTTSNMIYQCKTENDKIGRIKDKNVYIHHLKFHKSLLTVSTRKSIIKILKLKHKNISSFVGGIIEGSTITGLMYEFCHRSSLYNLLINPHIVFEHCFRLAFAMDAAKGLAFLHSKKIPHGRLTSHNCVIDHQWNLKLTDFGLDIFHSNKIKKTKKMVLELYNFTELSLQVDIYNYGVLLLEMCCHQSLIVNRQINLECITYDEGVSNRLISLIEKCLETNISSSLNINTVKTLLKKCISIYGYFSHDTSSVGEIYSRNLENHIEVLENKLQDTKNVNNSLFANYMPKSVINEMRSGSYEPLQYYDDVTVVCFKLHNADELSWDVFESVIDKVNTLLDGICIQFDLQKIQSIGSLWIYTGDIHHSNCIMKTIKAALKVIKTMNEHSMIISAAIDNNLLMCGVINKFMYTAMGEAVNVALHLICQSPANCVVISENVPQTLLDENYQVAEIKIHNKLDGVLVKGYVINYKYKLSENCNYESDDVTPLRKPSEAGSVHLSKVSLRRKSSENF